MDIVIIVISSLALLSSIIAITLIVKNSKKGTTSLGDSDIDKIRKSVVSSINDLSKSVSDLVATKNEEIMKSVVEKEKEIDTKIALLDKKYSESSKELVEKFNKFVSDYVSASAKQKDEIIDRINKEMQSFNLSVKEKLDDFKKDTKEALTRLDNTVKENLKEIREDNNKKLDDINKSVNEKLQETLESKLKDSFENVIKQISNVNQAVGEIKGLANDVGSLKHALTNVKTKGIIGEVLLGNIISEFLTKSQYEENVVIKEGGRDPVEYAVKLPGADDKPVLLPIDSKFPLEPYQKIVDSDTKEEIEEARKQLRNDLLKYAKDVHDKYIDVPKTTDFGIIFLPIEGIYLEALNSGLFEEIKAKHKIILTGPTTLSAFINSLSIGFKTLTIQKKSAEVFNLLGAVKTEFGKFASQLEKTQKKLTDASDELDTLVGTRTRKMNVALRQVTTEVDDKTAQLMFDDTILDDSEK